ncbi:MAG: hypothetical protein R3217_03375 [Gammaproteobacteria bacterium]|nr:hypothetical protein [Gammaproteobacteria bacterium]
MKFSNLIMITGLAALALPAQAADIGVGARVSTLGMTYEAKFALTDHFALRGGINQYDTDYEETQDDITYDFDAEFDSTHLFLDYHPFAGMFRITGGIVDNDSTFIGTGTSSGTYTLNGVSYTGAEVGTLSAGFGLQEQGTYLGVGWASAPKSSGLGFSVDVGVVLQDGPQAQIVSTGGLLSSDPTFQSNVDAEIAELNQDLEEFDTYPVVSIGISYTF